MICKILKLSNGDTVAGNIVEETSIYIDILRPVQLMIVPKGKNSVTILFGKIDHTINYEQPIRIFKSGIIFVGEPDSDFMQSYTEMYNSLERKLSFEDEDEVPDDLSNELQEIMKKLEATSNTSNKTYH